MGDAQHFSDTLSVLLLEVVQGQWRPQFLRQPPDGLLQVNCGTAALAGNPSRGRLGHIANTFLLPQKIDARVSGDSQNPGLELIGLAELPDVPETLQQDLLSHVFSVVNPAQHAKTDAKHVPVVLLDQQGVGCPIALPARANRTFIERIVQSELLNRLTTVKTNDDNRPCRKMDDLTHGPECAREKAGPSAVRPL
jgi:hypothetical protein